MYEGEQLKRFTNDYNISQDESVRLTLDSNFDLVIDQEYFTKIIKQNVSFQDNRKSQSKLSQKAEQTIKLKKPPKTESKFQNVWPFYFKIKDIMEAAYNKEEVKISQFQQFQKLFKLSQNQIKMVNCPDPVSLQTLRYAIFNKQQIPAPLVKVIHQMAKTNLVKEWHMTIDLIHKVFMFDLVSEVFQPPLDLYIQFVDNGLICASQEQLNEVLTRNQYLFKSVANNKELYSTESQKKRLIFNQFPYLLIIANKIKQKNLTDFNFIGFKIYLNTILKHLKFFSEDFLLQRYLPEAKCLYLKLRQNISSSDIQFLFTTLKSVNCLSPADFKILYSTRPNKVSITKQYKAKSWIKFWKIEQLCSKVLTKKDFHLSQRKLQQFCEKINFQNCYSFDLAQYYLIFAMLLQQTYNNLPFPRSAIKNIQWIFKSIPDRKKRKQCCYILLLQYSTLISQSPENKSQIIKQYNIPERQIDNILDQGRQIALDILLNQEDIILTFVEEDCLRYIKIVKRAINETKNKQIMIKAIELLKRLDKINNAFVQNSVVIQQNTSEQNQLVELLEIEVLNGKKLHVESITNVIKILRDNKNNQIKRSCLSILRYVIGNHQNGHLLPKNFQKDLIQFICKQYFQESLLEDCKVQILNLAIECTNLHGSYMAIDTLTKFFFKVYSKSSVNSFWNINSSYGIYMIALNLKKLNETYYYSAKQFLEDFLNKILKSYKSVLYPESKSSINILCATVAFIKNQVMLSQQLIQQLSLIALKNIQFTKIALIGIFYRVNNYKILPKSQRFLSNICQVLRASNNNQIIGIYILQIYCKKKKNLPSTIIFKIKQLTEINRQSLSWNRLHRLKNKIQMSQQLKSNKTDKKPIQLKQISKN